MEMFEFIRAADAGAAVATAAQATTAQQGADVRFIAGGTTLVDLMKLRVETPARLVDINRLPLDKMERAADGGLKIGATVRNSDLAYHETVKRDYAVLSQAILSGASAQLRNMATTAGNLLQRTRCVYFRDTAMACNKREPGTGCPAITGSEPIAGDSGDERTLHRHEPVGHVRGAGGARGDDSRRGPEGHADGADRRVSSAAGDTPERETVLEPGDLITHVTLPPPVAGSKQLYLKLRDRASYEFALASAAVVLTLARRESDAGAGGAGRRGDEAVAFAGGGSGARGSGGERGEFPQGGRGGAPRCEAAERERIQSRAGETLPGACARRRRRTPDFSGIEHGNGTSEIRTTSPLGRDTPRVDGPRKVTGRAQYTSDFHFPGMLYGVPVGATIANGRVVKIDAAAAEKMPGVRAIFHRGEHRQDFSLGVGGGFQLHQRRAAAAVRG